MATNLFRVGALATDTPGGVIALHARATTAGNLATFRKQGATVGYQVTAGKSLYIVKLIMTMANNSATVSGISLGYADNDIGIDVTTARTNPVALIGNPESNTTAAIGFGGIASTTTWNPFIFQDLIGPVPSQKYLYFMNQVASNNITDVIAYGIEQ